MPHPRVHHTTWPSRLHLQKTESFMAFRLSPVPSRVRRCPQASPRLKPLPPFRTSSNHGNYSRLPPSSQLESRCLAFQGCPHMNLQGWLLPSPPTPARQIVASPSWGPPPSPAGSTFLSPTPVQAPFQATPRLLDFAGTPARQRQKDHVHK